MRIKGKGIILILICIVIAITLAGCGSKPPKESKIKEDLVGRKIFINGNSFLGGTTYEIKAEELKKLEILKRQLNEKDRNEIINVAVELDDNYITYYGNLVLEYGYYDDNGWILDYINTEGDKLSIKANSALSEEDILKPLYDNEIVLAEDGKWILREEEVETVEIIERNTMLEKMKDIVTIKLISKNGSEMMELQDTFVYQFKENDGVYKWVYTGIENPEEHVFNHKAHVIEKENYEKTLYDGVNEKILRNVLVPRENAGQEFYNIIKVTEKGNEFKYTWNLQSKDEIKDIKIINQNTDLESEKDHVDIELSLEKDGVIAKGNLSLELAYNRSMLGRIGWHISNYEVKYGEEFTFEYTTEALSPEKIKKDILGKKFTYQSGFLIRSASWAIESGEVRKFELLGRRPFISNSYNNDFDPNTMVYDVELVLQGSETAIKGYASVIYTINEKGEHEFKEINRVSNFETISQEEVNRLADYQSNEFEQSLNTIKESEVEEITFDEIVPSSTLEPNTDKYKTSYLVDGKNDTAWVEGKEGDGIGESVTFKANSPFLVKKIVINNGYKKSQDIYKANNRVKNIKISFSDESEVVKELSDDFNKIDTFELDIEVEAEWIKFTILDVYEGSKYEDTYVSEISVLGKMTKEN